MRTTQVRISRTTDVAITGCKATTCWYARVSDAPEDITVVLAIMPDMGGSTAR